MGEMKRPLTDNDQEYAETRVPIEYVCKNIPQFEVPTYKGKRYEAMVPDTLDLQERASLAVNGLTGPTDPEADYELYWRVYFKHNPMMMHHDGNDHVQVKFMEALPLMRLISGSQLNDQVDQRWMEVVQHMQGPDGSLYYPVKGRPWCRGISTFGGDPQAEHYTRPFDDGRLLGATAIYYLLTGDSLWVETGKRLIQGLADRAINNGDYAYFSKIRYDLAEAMNPSDPMPDPKTASCAGWTVQGLAQFYRVTGHEPARDLAVRLAYGLKDHAGMFDMDGSFIGFRHFHRHTMPLLGIAELAMLIDDDDLLTFAQRGYEFARAHGEPLVGYFPENIDSPVYQTSEICEVADMISLGLKLTGGGIADYWDDIDRWVRNQFIEGQLLQYDWINRMVADSPRSAIDPTCQTTERVGERNIGAFAGWPSANDWYVGHGKGIMHCCTGNATRTLYYVWENILNHADGEVRVNLLLNRASPWVDVDSHIPYTGQVDVKVKEPCDLSIRIPEWVTQQDACCKVNGSDRCLDWDGRYGHVGSVKPGDVVTMKFPIELRSDIVHIEKQRYTLVRKGNDVIVIDPPGRNCPLYQRTHYRESQTRWKRMTRFVAQTLLYW